MIHLHLQVCCFQSFKKHFAAEQVSFKESQRPRSAIQVLLKKPFKDLYALYQQRSETIGPVDIRGPGYLWLLLKFEGQQKTQHATPWIDAVHRRGRTPDFLFQIWEVSAAMPHMMDRTRVQGSLRLAFKAFSLRSPGRQ